MASLSKEFYGETFQILMSLRYCEIRRADRGGAAEEEQDWSDHFERILT